MAKKTKDSNLSLEERLEQALIPNWDEPYKLPENWCWTKIGVITDLYRGVSYKKHEGHSEKGINDCLVMRGGNIQEGEIDTDADNIYVDKKLVSEEQYVKKHDVVIVSSTGSTKVIGRAGISFADYDDVAFGAFLTLVRPNESVHKPYVSYYFQGDMYRNRMRQLASGVNINNIRNEYITDTPIPLPPLNEQKRIISHIEALFAKLDEAKENAQEVVDGFETRKASILHKAFSGELTAKWREKNGISNNTWVTKSLEDVCESIYDGDHMPPPKSESGIPFLVISNVNTGYLSFEDTRFVPKEYYDNITDTRKPQKGDVLYTLVGSYGIPVVVDSDNAFCFQRHMALLKPLSIDTYFLWYLLQTQEMYQKASKIAKGVAQLTVPIKGLRAMAFSCPSSEEQQEIVKLLDMLIKKEQGAKEAAETVVEQIDTMKKAILARAFRGELGTNDPSEESAVELLKQVLSTASKPKKPAVKRTVIPKSLESRIKTDLEHKIIKLYIQNNVDILTIDLIMSVSSKKFDIMEALRNLQQRGILEKENDKYKLLG